MNITFYKYRITNRETKECRLCFQYEDVKKFTNIPFTGKVIGQNKRHEQGGLGRGSKESIKKE